MKGESPIFIPGMELAATHHRRRVLALNDAASC